MDTSATAVRFDDNSMWVELSDGRTLGVPYAWFPRLLNATLEQREAVEIGRFGLHWEDIDEDISIAGLLAGRRDQTIWKDDASPIYSVKLGRKAQHVEVRKVHSEMNKDQLFVERRPQGDYAVRKGNAERASAVMPTQKEAIHKARELNPDSNPLVERVRHTTGGVPDKWRKP
jgi:hypothetical protein